MNKKIISTNDVPAAIGPYSQAILAGDTLYCSGQIAIDPGTGLLVMDTITAETEDWLYAYLLASYAGLSDDEMQTYIAFARTDAAQAFNGVLFDSFGTVFTSISRALGRAVADRMLAQDI